MYFDDLLQLTKYFYFWLLEGAEPIQVLLTASVIQHL